jgi:hypothetical protein
VAQTMYAHVSKCKIIKWKEKRKKKEPKQQPKETFIHSFNKYSLGTFCVPDSVRDTAAKRIWKLTCTFRAYFLVGKSIQQKIAIWLKKTDDCGCVDLFLVFYSVHCFLCLFLCQHHAVFVTMAL